MVSTTTASRIASVGEWSSRKRWINKRTMATASITITMPMMPQSGPVSPAAAAIRAGRKVPKVGTPTTLRKTTTMKQVENRNSQFLNIARLKEEYKKRGCPIISMDTKEKVDIGNHFRAGALYAQKEICVYDHDFNSFGKGKAVPHGIYDIIRNTGHIDSGTGKDTSEFACDSLREWYHHRGRHEYPDAASLLILCDGVGSDSSRHYIFKEDIQKSADEIGIEIRIAHYPPYTSEYNPIEHRMFCHVTRACKGVIFDSIERVKEFMEKTKTKKGLNVEVRIIDKIYETGRKVKEGFKKNMSIVSDDYLKEWNYRAIPNGKVI